MGFLNLFKKETKTVDYESLSLSEVVEFLSNPDSIPKKMNKDDLEKNYLLKLFCYPENDGGFGFSNKEEIGSSEVFRKCKEYLSAVSFSVGYFDNAFLRNGIYKTPNCELVNNWFIEIARMFFKNGLKSTKACPLIMECIFKALNNRDGFKEKVFYNDESFLYDQRLYSGTENFVACKFELLAAGVIISAFVSNEEILQQTNAQELQVLLKTKIDEPKSYIAIVSGDIEKYLNRALGGR